MQSRVHKQCVLARPLSVSRSGNEAMFKPVLRFSVLEISKDEYVNYTLPSHTVFGWIAGERVGTTGMNRVTVYESSAIQAQLPLGFLKGASRVSPSALVSFSIGVTSGTAG